MDSIDVEAYSRIGPQYYSNHIPSLLRRYLDTSDYHCLLDCGCGDGSLLDALDSNSYLDNRDVYALDLSRNRIDLIKTLVKNNTVKAQVDNAETMATIEDNSIDFFISTAVIEHVDDKKMISNINRVVKKNGTVYLSTVYKKWYGWYFHRNNGKWVLDPTHLREYTKDSELIDLFLEKGFKIMDSQKGATWYPVIDFFIKRLRIKDRKIFDKKILALIRRIKIPVLGYYNWEIVMKKI